MDPLGIATTTLDYGLRLKSLFDQASDNQAQFRIIAADIVDELETFQATIKQNQDGLDGEWQKSLSDLQYEMGLAYSRCAKTFKPKSGISEIKSRFNRIKNSDRHRQELERLQSKIRDMKTKFLVDATLRQEMKMAETHQLVVTAQDMGREAHAILQSIERRMELLVAQSEADPGKARDLICVTSLTNQQMEVGMAQASRVLDSNDSSPLEKRYASVKKRTLEAAIKHPSGAGADAAPVATSVTLTTQIDTSFLNNDQQSFVYTAEPEPLTFQPPDMNGTDAFQETLRAVKNRDEDGGPDGDLVSLQEKKTPQHSVQNNSSVTPTEPVITPQESQHLHELATSVTNVAYQLSTFSRNDEALPLYQEAVDIRRRLAAQGDETYLSELSQSLHNLAHHCRLMGRDEEGIALDSEVVTIRRRLVEQNPKAFLPSLAKGLHMLGHVYSCVLREQEALPFFQEVVKIYRELAAEDPSSHKADLASSLHYLAHHLRKLGRDEEGLTLDLESVEIRRQLNTRT